MNKTVHKILKWGIPVVFLILAGMVLYGFYISSKIEKRFSARRWSIPSTVYSDTTILYPGQRFSIQRLKKKLKRLGYQNVSRQPAKNGENRFASSLAQIYLNDIKIPSYSRAGFAVDIQFSKNKINSIKNAETGDLLPIIEIEPEEIMKFFGPERERRQLISIDEVPQSLIHAALAAEDNRFFDHHGFDPIGMIRAFFINLRHASIRQGGSTITQQLVKNYFLSPERKFTRKLNELILSIVMELKYEKKEILEIYLNEIYLGQNESAAVNGVGEASQFYFGKAVSELTIAEAATIAGLIRAPNHYSPFVDQGRCRKRRDHVLNIMAQKEWITAEELKTASKLPIHAIDYVPRNRQAPYFMDYLSRQLQTLYSPEALSSLGLKIFTTLDTQVQTAAETALRNGLRRLEKSDPRLKRKKSDQKLQGAVLVMQPKTGYILAMVGGRDYKISQFNRIDQGRRQPGSAFKPFVCLAALDKFTPATMFSNEPRTYTFNKKQ